MANLFRQDIILSEVRTASGTGPLQDTGSTFSAGTFELEVTDRSGVLPELTVWVQQELPDLTFQDIGAFPLVTNIGKWIINKESAGQSVGQSKDGEQAPGTINNSNINGKFRAKWSITGVDPSFTFYVRAYLEEAPF